MARTYIYVVDRDFGFAPNPFHGVCTLATCKPRIRSAAAPGDWVVGVGGRRLQATGKCVFAMQVTRKLPFTEYWAAAEFQIKKPIRNGSSVRLVGDNIYEMSAEGWRQSDSHHSNEDGTPNLKNLVKDTSANAVLVADHFYYFGAQAEPIPGSILRNMGYVNSRNHRTFSTEESSKLIDWLRSKRKNYLYDDPSDFLLASARYSGVGSRISIAETI